MASIDVKIEKSDLQLTKEAHFRLFEDFYTSKTSLQAAFIKTEGALKRQGYRGHYSSFESFKKAFYTKMKK